MANKKQLKRLQKQGVKAWIQWRKEHLNIEPNLILADLRRADLILAFLSSANLRYALQLHF
jgi:uncharacterized protein YjbI with pentapeptide repeats